MHATGIVHLAARPPSRRADRPQGPTAGPPNPPKQTAVSEVTVVPDLFTQSSLRRLSRPTRRRPEARQLRPRCRQSRQSRARPLGSLLQVWDHHHRVAAERTVPVPVPVPQPEPEPEPDPDPLIHRGSRFTRLSP